MKKITPSVNKCSRPLPIENKNQKPRKLDNNIEKVHNSLRTSTKLIETDTKTASVFFRTPKSQTTNKKIDPSPIKANRLKKQKKKIFRTKIGKKDEKFFYPSVNIKKFPNFGIKKEKNNKNTEKRKNLFQIDLFDKNNPINLLTTFFDSFSAISHNNVEKNGNKKINLKEPRKEVKI